jgi:hypothetical protein
MGSVSQEAETALVVGANWWVVEYRPQIWLFNKLKPLIE